MFEIDEEELALWIQEARAEIAKFTPAAEEMFGEILWSLELRLEFLEKVFFTKNISLNKAQTQKNSDFDLIGASALANKLMELLSTVDVVPDKHNLPDPPELTIGEWRLLRNVLLTHIGWPVNGHH